MEKDFTVSETMAHTKNWIVLLRKFIFVGKGDFPKNVAEEVVTIGQCAGSTGWVQAGE